jgi:hypothetical protein
MLTPIYKAYRFSSRLAKLKAVDPSPEIVDKKTPIYEILDI